MTFTNDKFVSSGIYIVTNVKHDLSIACREDDDDDRLVSSSAHDYKWTITLLASKKWIIQGQSNGFFVNLNPDPEEEDELTAQQSQDEAHQWIIKQCIEDRDSYIIYSPKQTGLFWGLPDADEGTAPQLTRDNKATSSRWRFRKVEDVGDATRTGTHPSPLPVTRPTSHDGFIKNKVAITIPPEWLTTISAVSVGQCINLIRVSRMVQGALETQDLLSGWDSIDQAMDLSGSDGKSYSIPAVDEPVVVVLEFFHSRNTRRRDPLGLPGRGDLSSSFRITSSARPSDIRSFPDHQTFCIFDEEPATPNSGPSNNAIVVVQSSGKIMVDVNNPDKPALGTVKEGYDKKMDMRRPGYLDQYLENYNIIFIIDDSASMGGERWEQVRAALTQIGNEATQYDADGIDICFLNSSSHNESITTQEAILNVFDQVRPGGLAPIGAKLEEVLGRIIHKLDDAMDTPAYSKIKPVDIVVLTGGVPSDDPATVIQTAARRLDEGLHHPNAVGIQFVQIGNDEGAEEALKQLCMGPVRGMVDTVPHMETFTPERLRRVSLGGLHPSIRAKITNSSRQRYLYYRIYTEEEAVVSKKPADPDDPFVGRINVGLVVPPHTVSSIKRCIAKTEGLDHTSPAKLFIDRSSQSPMGDGPVLILSNNRPGSTAEKPMAYVQSSVAVSPKVTITPHTSHQTFIKRLRVATQGFEGNGFLSCLTPGDILYTDGVIRYGAAVTVYEAINRQGKVGYVATCSVAFC